MATGRDVEECLVVCAWQGQCQLAQLAHYQLTTDLQQPHACCLVTADSALWSPESAWRLEYGFGFWV
jgi:hypothetical protein